MAEIVWTSPSSPLDGCPVMGVDCNHCRTLNVFDTTLIDNIDALDTKVVIHCRECDHELVIFKEEGSGGRTVYEGGLRTPPEATAT